VFLAVHPRPTTRQDSGGGPPPQLPRDPGQPPCLWRGTQPTSPRLGLVRMTAPRLRSQCQRRRLLRDRGQTAGRADGPTEECQSVCALVVVIVVLRLAFVSQDPTRFVENARVTSHEEV